MDVFPPYVQTAAESVHFISYFNFLLGQLKVHPSEEELIERFGAIGIGPGYYFDADALNGKIRRAIEAGIASALEQIKASGEILGERNNGWVLTRRIFGSREQMQGLYLIRAGAAHMGIYGNDLEEAYYPTGDLDEEGELLDASKHSYVLRFEKDEIPPVDAFWSITMYNLPEQLMVENPIDRYSIGDRTEGLSFGRSRSLELYFSMVSPAEEKRARNASRAGPPLHAHRLRDVFAQGADALTTRVCAAAIRTTVGVWTPAPPSERYTLF